MRRIIRHLFLTVTTMPLIVFSACRENIDERFEREAHEFTQKKCPVMVDKCTRLDSIIYDIHTHTVGYHYTLSGEADNPEVYKTNEVSSILLAEVKNSTIVKQQKDAGCSFLYTYRSAKDSAVILASVRITKEDYAKD